MTKSDSLKLLTKNIADGGCGFDQEDIRVISNHSLQDKSSIIMTLVKNQKTLQTLIHTQDGSDREKAKDLFIDCILDLSSGLGGDIKKLPLIKLMLFVDGLSVILSILSNQILT